MVASFGLAFPVNVLGHDVPTVAGIGCGDNLRLNLAAHGAKRAAIIGKGEAGVSAGESVGGSSDALRDRFGFHAFVLG